MPSTDFHKTIKLDNIDDSLQKEIFEKCGVDIEQCMECGKCSGGCSNAHIFDYTPRKIVQLIKMGDEETLLSMDSLWTCVSCQLCVDRCPSRINIPRIMDYMREKAYKQGIEPTRKNVELFNELMLDSVRKIGRVAETAMMIKFNLKSGQYLKDADIGRRMFFKGKLNPFSPKVKKIDQVRRLFKDVLSKREG